MLNLDSVAQKRTELLHQVQKIIDTEDHITGECCLHEATLWDEATLEQVVKSKNNWLCSPEKQFWTSLEEDILDSLMDCTYYKVTCYNYEGHLITVTP